MAARTAIERLRLTPVLFELGARPHPPRSLYRAYVEQSDVFVGIYGLRYGWVAPGMEVSGLEDEYLLASGIPKLVYVKRGDGEQEPELRSLLDRIAGDGVSYRLFETAEELANLLADDLALLVSERFARTPLRGAVHRSLPAPASSFVGRDAEVEAVVGMLGRGDVRLVTLMGPGGVGKTRLALESARLAVEAFADGAAFVQLAHVTEPSGVMAAIAEALGVTDDAGSPLEDVRSHLAELELLLVLDNMEHVLGAGPTVSGLLAIAPGLTVLATSRVRLDVSGEHCFLVSPMSVPAETEPSADVIRRADAVRLFTARAASTGRTTAANDVSVVAEIVRRLDGLPLAIELAAAQVRLVPVEQILARLGSRLDLGRGPRDAEERHRTMRSAVAWSYELLDEPARRLFEALSVFVGGFSIEAAAAVADEGEDVDEQLAKLVDSSLLTREPAPATGVRLGMLETIREYAAERLDERGKLALTTARHLAYFAMLADEAYEAPRELRQIRLLRLDEDRDNFRAAFEEAMRTAPAEGVRLAGALESLWSRRGLQREGRAAIDRALAAAPDAPAAWRARALLTAAWLTGELGEHDDASRLALEALDGFRAAGDARQAGSCLVALGWSAESRGDTAQAAHYFEDSYRIFSTLPDASRNVDTTLRRARWRRTSGDLSEARHLYAQALEYLDLHGPDDDRASVLDHLGVIDEAKGDLTSARRSYVESVAVWRRIGYPRAFARALVRLGHVDAADGRIDDARSSYMEAVELQRELGDRPGMAHTLECIAHVALSYGNAEAAARLVGHARAMRDAIGLPVPTEEQREAVGTEDELRKRLGSVRFAALCAEGAASGTVDAAALARTVLER